MEETFELVKNGKLHITVFIIAAIAEMINIRTIPLGRGSIMFLPLLYAIVMGLSAYKLPVFSWIGEKQSLMASKIVVISIALFIAKVSVTSGAEINNVINAGPALLLHELGNLGSMIIGLPLALFLGFKRESIGMTYSIDREPNVGLIASKYGLDSPEGRGVMVTYACGTIIGTVFISLLVSFLAAVTSFDPLALAIACGVGSGSMLAASSSVLAQTFPAMAGQIAAYAGTSNVIANASGIMVSVLIGLPLCNFMYRMLSHGKAEQAENIQREVNHE